MSPQLRLVFEEKCAVLKRPRGTNLFVPPLDHSVSSVAGSVWLRVPVDIEEVLLPELHPTWDQSSGSALEHTREKKCQR